MQFTLFEIKPQKYFLHNPGWLLKLWKFERNMYNIFFEELLTDKIKTYIKLPKTNLLYQINPASKMCISVRWSSIYIYMNVNTIFLIQCLKIRRKKTFMLVWTEKLHVWLSCLQNYVNVYSTWNKGNGHVYKSLTCFIFFQIKSHASDFTCTCKIHVHL